MFEQLTSLFSQVIAGNGKPVKFTVEMPQDFETKKVEMTLGIQTSYPYGKPILFFYNAGTGQITENPADENEGLLGYFPKSLVTISDIGRGLAMPEAYQKINAVVQEEIKRLG